MYPHYEVAISLKRPCARLTGPERPRSGSSRMVWVAAIAWLVAGSPGCATGLPVSEDRVVLAFENASPDAIRLYMQIADRETLVARLRPFERGAVFLRTGTIPPGSGTARLLVVPVGGPAIASSVANTSSTIRSEMYSIDGLLAHRWIFTGSRIMADPR